MTKNKYIYLGSLLFILKQNKLGGLMSQLRPCRVIFSGDGPTFFSLPSRALPMSVPLELFGTATQVEKITGDPTSKKIVVRADCTATDGTDHKQPKLTLVGYLLGNPKGLVKAELDVLSGRGRIERVEI